VVVGWRTRMGVHGLQLPPGFKPHAVVMTATIHPPADAPGLARRDPAVRLRDYMEALAFYLSMPDELVDRVVVLENTDADLGPMRELVSASSGHRKRTELIGFQANDHAAHLGKGYGEFRMLDEGLARSSLLRETGAGPMWKVTGRLKIANLADLVRTAPLGYDVYCDLRDLPMLGDRMGNRWMDLRVASWSLAGYDRYLRGKYPEMRNYYVPEKSPFGRVSGPEDWLYVRMRDAMAHPERFGTGGHLIVPRFRVQPVIVGYGGHSNTDYQQGVYKVKERVRAVMRHVVPGLWV
jgi:hypothetical protein